MSFFIDSDQECSPAEHILENLHWRMFLSHRSSTSVCRLRISLKSSLSILPSEFESHIATICFLNDSICTADRSSCSKITKWKDKIDSWGVNPGKMGKISTLN